jgi:hypothetical protein
MIYSPARYDSCTTPIRPLMSSAIPFMTALAPIHDIDAVGDIERLRDVLLDDEHFHPGVRGAFGNIL